MQFTIRDEQTASKFSFLLQNLKIFAETINFVFQPGYLYIQSMDKAHVMLFEINLEKSSFDEYDVAENVTIGLNTNILSKLLSIREKGHSIHFSKSKSDTIDISFHSDDKNIYNKDFTIPLVDIDYEQMQIPKSEDTAEFALPSLKFHNIIQQLKLFGENGSIYCDEQVIKLGSNSLDSGNMEVNIDINDISEYSIDEGAKVELSFTLLYLSNISLFNKLSKEIHIYLIENNPIRITYYFNDDNNTMNSISLYLAPSLDN